MNREPGMEMHQVRYFLAVARHFNFTRAAEELRVTQPSLTRAVQKLESELGGPLFRRERSNTHLTELGRMMLPHLEAAFASAETAKRQAQRLQKRDIGALVLGVCIGIELRGPVALVIATARKLASLDVSVEIADTGNVERRLIAGEFDAVILGPAGDANERFDLHLIHSDDLVVAFADGHRLSQLGSIALEALDAEPLVARFGCRMEEALAGIMDARGLTRLVRHRMNDPRWMAEFVRNGFGCAILPAALATACELTYRKLDGVPLQHRTMLATVAGRRHSLAVATLIKQIGAARGGIRTHVEGAPASPR